MGPVEPKLNMCLMLALRGRRWPPGARWALLCLTLAGAAAAHAAGALPSGAAPPPCGEPSVFVKPGAVLRARNVTLVAQDKAKGVTWLVSLSERPAAGQRGSARGGGGGSGGASAGGSTASGGSNASTATWNGVSGSVQWRARAVALPRTAGNHETAVHPNGKRCQRRLRS